MSKRRGYSVTASAISKLTSAAVPTDAKFSHAYFDYQKNVFILIFEHDSFADIPEGCVIPIDSEHSESVVLRVDEWKLNSFPSEISVCDADELCASLIRNMAFTGDSELDHQTADNLIVNLLEMVGFKKTIEAFNDVEKFYCHWNSGSNQKQ